MRKQKIIRVVGAGASVAAHLAVLLALLRAGAAPSRLDVSRAEPAIFTVALLPKPLTIPPTEAAPTRTAESPPGKANMAKPAPARNAARHIAPVRTSIAVADKATLDPADGVSDAELAGAATSGGAGGSGGGGDCNMVQRVQTALRKDDLVRATLAAAHEARAIRIWNGDWIQGHGEDGKGLAAVREAIIWEVGFAPKSCQAQPVHGLVALTLADAVGPRLVMGGGEWRWSDLLTLKTADPRAR